MTRRDAALCAAYFGAFTVGAALTGCRDRARHDAPAADTPPAGPAATERALGPAAANGTGRAATPDPPAQPGAMTAPGDAWFAGAWAGTYEATSHRFDLPSKQGGLPEWKVDDPRRGVGRGTLTLTAQPDGTVVGSTAGPLGEHSLRGAFDGDAFAAKVVPSPTDPSGFAGTLVGHRDEHRVVGTLFASSADGHLARVGTITLAKAPP